MLKKIFSSLLLSFVMISFIGSSSISKISNERKAAVLNWGTFTDSMREGVGELDCKEEKIQNYLKNTQLREELFNNGEEEGLKMDVKGCYMEKNVDKYATWFIFLALAVTVGFLILQGVKTITGGDSGGGGGGGMPGMPGGGGGGSGDPMSAFKPALIGIVLLTFVLVGGLNTVILLAMFFIDLFN